VDGSLRKGPLAGETDALERDIRRISDARLWQFRSAASMSLVEYARVQLSASSPPPARPLRRSKRRNTSSIQCLDDGFGAPLCTYKRTNLLMHDSDRLASVVVQSPASGAAHHGGQSPSGGPRGTGADSGMGTISRRPRRARTSSS